MFAKPVASLTPNTYAYEVTPLVKPTGFREYDARWLFEKEINLLGIQALGMGLPPISKMRSSLALWRQAAKCMILA